MGFVEQWRVSRLEKAQEKAWTAFDVDDVNGLREAFKAGADVNLVDGAGFSIAHRAVQLNKTRLLETLDQAGANWGLSLLDGKTALHLAIENGQSFWVKAMLDRALDVNRASTLGTTALHQAARAGLGQIIRMLDQAGASWTLQDKQKLTPLDVLQKFHPALHATWNKVRADSE